MILTWARTEANCRLANLISFRFLHKSSWVSYTLEYRWLAKFLQLNKNRERVWVKSVEEMTTYTDIGGFLFMGICGVVMAVNDKVWFRMVGGDDSSSLLPSGASSLFLPGRFLLGCGYWCCCCPFWYFREWSLFFRGCRCRHLWVFFLFLWHIKPKYTLHKYTRNDNNDNSTHELSELMILEMEITYR